MSRVVFIGIILVGATAWAGMGAVLGEAGLGLGGVVVCGVIPAGVAVFAVSDEPALAAMPFSLTGGAGAGVGVYLAGEWWGGRSAYRDRSLLSALSAGGAAGLGALACFALAGREDDNTDENESHWILPGLGLLFIGAPAAAIISYNLTKEPSAGTTSAVTVTPAVAALAPAERGAPLTLTYGLSVAF